jgi:hypothetical protein
MIDLQPVRAKALPIAGGQQPVGSLRTLGFPPLLGEIAGVRWNAVLALEEVRMEL